MSWLYTIIFAGMMLSASTDPAVLPADVAAAVPAPAVAMQADETEKFEQTYPLAANGRVSVSNINGSIVIEAWDRSEVRLEATKVADSRETLAQVQIQVDSKADSFRVRSDYDNWKTRSPGGWEKNRKLEVHYRLSVPRGAVLDEIETVNGAVTLSDFTNHIKVSAVNGTVRATNLRGTTILSTVNGEVIADFDRLETGSRISLSTVNGSVSVQIPSDSNATVKADSLNGSIKNDFGLPVRKGEYVGRDMHGRIGTGEVQIKLNSVNGGLTLARRNDGRNLNPSTNLLQQRNTSVDDDLEGETGRAARRHAAAATRDAARAVRDSNKEAAMALRQAEIEIAKMGPELDKVTGEALRTAAATINSAEMKARIREGIAEQRAAMARMRDADFTAAVPRIQKSSASLPVKGVPTVTVDAKGCGVKVNGWDQQEVQYVVTQFAEPGSPEVTVKDSRNGDKININVANPDPDAAGGGFYNDLNRVRIEVFVPRKSDLKIITNGEVRLEGVSGELDIVGADEAINVRDSNGKLTVRNEDGRVRIVGFRGDLIAETTDGDVFLEGDFTSVSAKAVDGTYILTLPATANADLFSNTEIENQGLPLSKSGADWKLGSGGSKYRFNFVDGKLLLRSVSAMSSY